MNNNITIDKAVGIIYKVSEKGTDLYKVVEVTNNNAVRIQRINSIADQTLKPGCSILTITLRALNEERIILFNPYTTVSSESTFSKLFPFNFKP